ncbi:MAG: PEP-CTERM sorting domain-containing protein [Puniceicoccales bacterium]|jgi:autotransporter-associated beta strand protein|nr:PEP-CTERM sorting domain-containing protein [Puniceicoccales bacterium]
MKTRLVITFAFLASAAASFAGDYDFGGTQGSIGPNMSGTISDNITGTAGLAISAAGNMSDGGGGSGTCLTLSGDNSGLSGGVSITSGYVQFDLTLAIFDAANTITLNGGGILASASRTLANDFAIGENGGYLRAYNSLSAWNNALRLDGKLTGTGLLTKTDGGHVTLAGDMSGFQGSLRLGGGTLVVTNSTLAVTELQVVSGTSLRIFSNQTVTVREGVTDGDLRKTDGGHLTVLGDSSHSSTSFESSSSYDAYLNVGNGGTTGTLGTGAITMTGNRGFLVFNRSDGYNVQNAISGNATVEVKGGGTFTFSGANVYTRGTVVYAGTTLKVAHASALGAGAVELKSGATLVVDGIAVTGITDLTALGAAIEFADGSSMLGVSGTLTLDGATLYLAGLGLGTGSFDVGSVLFGNTSYDYQNNITISGLAGYTWVDNHTIDVTAVPEPSTYAFAGLALIGGMMILRRRRG